MVTVAVARTSLGVEESRLATRARFVDELPVLYPRLLRICLRQLHHNEADAEDVLQTALLKAWVALDSFRGEASLTTWLVRIVFNQVNLFYRDRWHQIIDADIVLDEDMLCWPAGDLDDELSRAELRTISERSWKTLPEMYQTVFRLLYVEELSGSEVANLLHISIPCLKSRALRSRSMWSRRCFFYRSELRASLKG